MKLVVVLCLAAFISGCDSGTLIGGDVPVSAGTDASGAPSSEEVSNPAEVLEDPLEPEVPQQDEPLQAESPVQPQEPVLEPESVPEPEPVQIPEPVQEPEQPELPGQNEPEPPRPVCTANALDQGGGWGWENEQSCRWPSSDMPDTPNTPAADADVPGPVTVPGIGWVDGRPICLTDASDGNGDGFGFENNRTCVVVNGTTANAQDPLLNTRWCLPWAEIGYGDYVLQNNTWNEGEVYSDNWHQCIELGSAASQYVAKWDYNWLSRDGGDEFSVKSYPQVYYGRKTGNSISGSTERLGLPAPLSQLPDFKVKYKYSETGNAERNVALESFFHTSCEAEEWNKQFEMMVWVGSPEIRTPGPKVTEVTFDGIVWDVHTNPTLGWGYVAFVARPENNEGWLDWNKFVDWTRFNGPAFGVPRLDDNTCMAAIEIGTETFWGQGTFSLDEFRVVVE